MSNLTQDLEMLRELNEHRRRAKELRKQALRPLKELKVNEGYRRANKLREEVWSVLDELKSIEDRNDVERQGKAFNALKQLEAERKAVDQTQSPFESKAIDFRRWVAADDDVEVALLVKVQSHREISEEEEENPDLVDASPALKKVLTNLDLKKLLQHSSEAEDSSSFPVLLAARAMQALVSRAETVFEPATMYCYYRIIRELYGVAQPNWTVGAARAGVGGKTSAFVTNECIRAIFAFERALKRTYTFFEETAIFYKYFSSLDSILKEWKIESGPLHEWAKKSIEASWLNCQIATSPRNREMALFFGEKNGGNRLLLPDQLDPEKTMANAQEYFDGLPDNLEQSFGRLFQKVAEVYDHIYHGREDEDPKITPPIKDLGPVMHPKGTEYVFNPARLEESRAREEEISKFNRTATAHSYALRTIENAVFNAHKLRQIIQKNSTAVPGEKPVYQTERILKELAKEFYTIRRHVHHVLEPSKQYLKWVLDRELAAPKETFDAGELAFAATSYGAIHDWRLDDRLARACELLVKSLPDTGRLPTKRPFHASRRGYRTIPIGCEMTRALATLLQKTAYVFDAKFVDRMLGIFQENFAELHESTAERKLIGWNFDGAPDPDKPAVWVTAVSVLALDRIVRMLNTRINEIVLTHFDVAKPEWPHTQLTLRHLIYSDYVDFQDDAEGFTAIHLQKARAHVMRASVPKRYKRNDEDFSTIYYGPPHTGKTTLAESLALSARVPLLRLSPSDLILQGQELIEGRAHDVFEALSMLTQCVIIFDEFEPVLKSRGRGSSSSRDRLGRIGDILENISEKDDPKFRFVLGGMFPKLIKLHDSAGKQSFVYCLATNRLGEIDSAAKRKGRFDKRIPIYKPDALSRAGTLLYYLGRAKEEKRRETEAGPEKAIARSIEDRNPEELRRFFEIVAKTVGEPADRISKLFKDKKVEKCKHETTKTVKYVLCELDKPEELGDAKASLNRLKKEMRPDGSQDEDEGESKKRRSICEYEERIVTDEGDLSKGETADTIIKCFNQCLRFKDVPKGDGLELPAR